MILADATTASTPSWESTMAVAALFGAGLSLLFAGLMAYYMKRQTDLMAIAATAPTKAEISNQPLTVEVVKALHEQFADREEFMKHVNGNTERHAQLFKQIDRVERETRADVNRRFEALALDRQQTMEKLNTQFTFIRETLSAINREMQLKRGDEIV